jgi:(+)-trans-carveol dehydrogenase
MTGRVLDKVALVTGAARGQGRSHALRLAQEGADIIAVDMCRQIPSVPYAMAGPDDLAETVDVVRAEGRRVVAVEADIREKDALAAATSAAVSELGRLDIVCANAGISSVGRAMELSEQAWQDVLDVNLTGVWHTATAAIPHIVAGGRGGSVVVISSVAGGRARANVSHYVSSKHGVIGLARALAIEHASDNIRVNSVLPGTVNTPMFMNDTLARLFRPDLEEPSMADLEAASRSGQLLPVPWVEPIDVSNAVLFLASEEARYITGVALPVDAGTSLR